MSSFEERTEKVIVDSVKEMKADIIDSIKGEVNQLVDSRSKELEDRKIMELNITVFNLPEYNNCSGQDNKEEDELDFLSICTDLGLNNVNITYPLGWVESWKIRFVL